MVVQEVEHQIHQARKVQVMQEVLLHLREIQEDLELGQVIIMVQQEVVDTQLQVVMEQILQVATVVQEQIFHQHIQV